jgi:hypothetical protein
MEITKKLIITRHKYTDITKVPKLTLEWACASSESQITIDDINDIINSYEEWLDEHYYSS